MLELRNVRRRMTITIALRRLKSFSLEPCSLAFFFVNVFIADVSCYNSNTMPVMILLHSSKEKGKLCGKKCGF